MNKIANTEVEINIFNLLKKLWKKKFLITFVAIAFATAGLFYSLFIVTPQYTSSTRIYVINPNTPNNSITAQDLQAGSFLANDYKENIMTRLEIVDSKLRQAKKTEEYFNAIRTNIQFSGKENKILAITSVREGEGKSTTSTSLALSLAQAGFKTLLIDADTRNSVMSGTFKATGTIKGLTNYLSGNADLGDIICETNVPRLMVVPSGKVPPNPTALLQNAYFNKMIEAIKNIFDYIIIDTPPIGLVVDAAIISNACDGFILVTQAGRIKRNYVEKAKEQMEQSGSKFLGIILNKVSESVATYGDYGDYGNYGKRDRKRK